MPATILPPRSEELLSPLLASLPAASISPQPPTALLPLLSPILRQRVQLLSASTQDPWLPLLCYDSAKATKLETVVKNERFEPHPVSGLVEVDWETEVEIQYRRLDAETLQALVSVRELDLNVRLVWCVNDELGGRDGWRIGEVAVLDGSESGWGHKGVAEAESNFTTLSNSNAPRTNGRLPTPDAHEEEDDEDYWAQYDNTPARTPAPDHSPAAVSSNNLRPSDDDDSYYAQYASVQPAMDNHDPDEAQQNGDVESSLGRDEITSELQQHLAHNSEPPITLPATNLEHPRPRSSTSSSHSVASDTVARLEERASESEKGSSELGIKQHIGTTIKSLYRLAKVAGIDREEFERLVKTELDCLALMDEDDC